MITYFPILDSSDQKKKACTFRRGLLCSNKLDNIFKRLKNPAPNAPNPNFNPNPQQSPQAAEISEQQSTLSPSRYDSFQQGNKKRQPGKRGEGLHKSFNRTKTDWDHNFVGNQYRKKIKEELRGAKWASFVLKDQRDQAVFYSKQAAFDTERNQDQTLASSYKRGLSEQQLQRIKTMKQKRRNKMSKNLSYKDIEIRKKTAQNLPEEASTQKLAPWQDYPSRLSSMLMKKL